MEQAVIFDMDGTLWDSVNEIVVSWNRTLERFPEAGIRVNRDMLLGLMGKTMDQFARSLMPDLSFARAAQIMHVCEEEENEYLRRHGAPLLGDVRGVFARLRRAGYAVCIVSNCQSGYIEAFLEHYRLQELVDDIECYGNTGQGKAQNLKMLIERNGFSQYCYVGDTKGDYDACAAAGVPFIWAAYGFGTVCGNVPQIGSLEQLVTDFDLPAGEKTVIS